MSTSKLHKSFIVRFRRITIGQRKKAPEKPKDECIEKVRRKASKPKSSAISALAGCGCQRRLDIDLDPIPANSQMPEVCSVQSLPSCSSSPENKAEQCHEWRFVASFDEMLKRSSSSLHTEEVRYIDKSSIDNNSLLELQIQPVKFNDMVTKFRRNEHETSCVSQPVTRGFASPHRKAVNDSPTTSVTKMLKTQVTNSLLIMKNSSDPQREFRDSMVEMIHENKISSGKDLEELLACYLLLNSAAYHDVIIQVFKQIWADLIHTGRI